MNDPSPAEPRRRRVNRGLFWAAVAVTIIGWAPLLCVLAASSFANAYGCELNEGDIHPCVVAGHDFGPLLYDLGMMGWLMILGAPLMLLSLAMWIVILILALRRQ